MKRYKVIADYPNSANDGFEIGQIIQTNGVNKFIIIGDNYTKWAIKPEDYPAIFKELEEEENKNQYERQT